MDRKARGDVHTPREARDVESGAGPKSRYTSRGFFSVDLSRFCEAPRARAQSHGCDPCRHAAQRLSFRHSRRNDREGRLLALGAGRGALTPGCGSACMTPSSSSLGPRSA
jgi:hypothetical protein